MRHWYRIEAMAGAADVAEIYVYDYIGKSFWDDDAVSATKFIEELQALADSVKTLRVHINSPGGDVFHGIAIANALRDQRAKGRTVETVVDGLAASAASIVAMAGVPLRIADNAMLMIHHAWSITVGNGADHRKTADMLDKVADQLVATYQWKTTKTAEEIVALLDAETWMGADEAIENGFADQKVEGLRAAASIHPKAAAALKVPEQFKARVEALLAKPEAAPESKSEPVPAPSPAADVAAAGDVVRLCAAAGLDLAFAQALIGENLSAAAVEARITSETQARQLEASRSTEIRAACKAVNLPDLADSYITGGMDAKQVRAQLTVITAKLDKVEIDAHIPPDHGTRAKTVIDSAAIYAERNKVRNPAS